MQVNLEKWYKDTSKSLRKSGAEGYYTFFINFLKISFILLTKGGKKREMERERENKLFLSSGSSSVTYLSWVWARPGLAARSHLGLL